MAMDVFGQADSGVTLLCSGAHTPKACLAGHGEQPVPHAYSSPITATSLQIQGKPLIQGGAEITWALFLLQWGPPFLSYSRSIPLALPSCASPDES